MKHLDLFSGIGGFSLAAQWAGFETVQFVEKDKFCQQVLAKHWPNVPIHDDIKTFNRKEPVTLLTGGFPCQPFSVSGKQKGFSDDRYLWPEMLRIINHCKPHWVIAENVPGIIPHLDSILRDLEREAYSWRAFLIPASTVGAPHKRERLWIIAHTNSIGRDNGWGDRETRYLQSDIDRYVEKIQQTGSQFIPESWKAFNAENWLASFPDSNCIESNEGAKNIESSAERSQWQIDQSKIGTNCTRNEGTADQPPIPGVDDGLPNRLDRNKSLGNAIVPQVVYPFMKMIYEIETSL